MLSYCYTKWWVHDPECDAYWKDNCHKQDILTEKCRKIAIQQYKSTYQGRACIKSFWSKMTIANRGVEKSGSEGLGYVLFRPFVNYATVFILFALMIWKSHNNEVINNEWDTEFTTDSDYSVLLKGLPNNEKLDKFDNINIKKILQKRLKQEGYEVTQMNFIYDTEKFLNLKQKYTDEMTELAKKRYRDRLQGLENSNENQELLVRTPGEIDRLKDELLRQKDLFDDSHGDGMVGSVFISFKTAKQARQFMSHYKKRGVLYDLLGCCGSQNRPFEVTIPEEVLTRSEAERQGQQQLLPEEYRLFAEMPPEPGDVMWENLAYKPYEIFWRKGLVNLLSLVVFLLGFSLLIGLEILFVRIFLSFLKRI